MMPRSVKPGPASTCIPNTFSKRGLVDLEAGTRESKMCESAHSDSAGALSECKQVLRGMDGATDKVCHVEILEMIIHLR